MTLPAWFSAASNLSVREDSRCQLSRLGAIDSRAKRTGPPKLWRVGTLHIVNSLRDTIGDSPRCPWPGLEHNSPVNIANTNQVEPRDFIKLDSSALHVDSVPSRFLIRSEEH